MIKEQNFLDRYKEILDSLIKSETTFTNKEAFIEIVFLRGIFEGMLLLGTYEI